MTTGPALTVSGADYLWFVDRALGEMSDIVRLLGDDLVNRRPALEGANSAFVRGCVPRQTQMEGFA